MIPGGSFDSGIRMSTSGSYGDGACSFVTGLARCKSLNVPLRNTGVY
jgi:hypothetical protein